MERLKVPGSADFLDSAPPADMVILFLLVLVLAAIIALVRPKRSSWRRDHWRSRARDDRPPPDVSDPSQQMNFISKVDFETVPVLNGEEFRVYAILERALSEHPDGCRLMAQTSLGEILRPRSGPGSKQDRDLAYRSINSKRLDFAIFNRSGHLAVAIEYQGSGHYHAKSFMRDAVKREVLRKAGVTFLEVPADFRPEEIAEQVRRALRSAAPHR